MTILADRYSTDYMASSCFLYQKLWFELAGAFQVPEGVGRIVILLSVSDQRTGSDVVWFDDVELCRLP
jgi:hypothetical protein